MSTINPSLSTSYFLGNGDFTWWLGTIKNADDPDARLGRVKVNILGYHKPDEKPSNLPWALVMAPTDSPGANGVGSAGNSLKPGSFVVGFFLDYPDCQQPVVLGTLLGKIESVVNPESQARKDYPGAFENSIEKRNTDTTNKGQSAATLSDGQGKGGAATMSTIAAATAHSTSNPSGKLEEIPIGDGKNAGDKTLDSNLTYAILNIINTLSYARVVKDEKTKLTIDIDSEEQTIPVESTENFPPRGLLKIGNEMVGYNNIATKKFVLSKRGFGGTTPSEHKKGEQVELILKSKYLGGEGAKAGDTMGIFIDTLVDIDNVIKTNLTFIKDAIWWLVNQIKSFLMGQITQILNAIGIAAISPVPMFGKILTDVIILILKEIACIFDGNLLEAIYGAIESAIDSVVQQFISAIDAAEGILNSVFDAVFEIVNIAEQIIDTVNDIISGLSSIGDLKNLESLSQLNIAGILEFIFSLLNIGCNNKTDDPSSITFSSCSIANVLNTANLYDSAVSGVNGRWNPEYSKIMGTFSEAGSMIAFDDTPYNTRMILEHGPSKSGIHIYDNGDVRITNSQNQTEVTIKDKEIIVHGNYKMVVDGDYHLKVGKNMHVEVLGQYNMAVNRESKISYAGEHETYFKNDSRLEANNGLAIVASKLGISASGQTEIHTPIYTRFTTEVNEFNLGSKNLFTLFKNDFIGLNKTKFITGNNLESRIGTNFAQGIGLSNIVQMGTETEFWGGTHNQVGAGVWTENKLGVDSENTLGVTTFNKLAVSLENVTGAAFKNTTGIFGDTAQGIKFGTSAAIDFTTAPLITMN